MAYARPTVADFIARFPRFATVDNAVIQSALDEAPVDDSWIEADFAPAILLYAAHSLTLDGLGTGTDAELAAQGMGSFTRIKSGTIDLTRSDSSIADAGSYRSTSFGSRFYALLRRNKGGALAVASPYGCITGYAKDAPWPC